jgi:hypothetical protein
MDLKQIANYKIRNYQGLHQMFNKKVIKMTNNM